MIRKGSGKTTRETTSQNSTAAESGKSLDNYSALNHTKTKFGATTTPGTSPSPSPGSPDAAVDETFLLGALELEGRAATGATGGMSAAAPYPGAGAAAAAAAAATRHEDGSAAAGAAPPTQTLKEPVKVRIISSAMENLLQVGVCCTVSLPGTFTLFALLFYYYFICAN